MTEKILVVDDELAIVNTVRYNLEREGYQVITAYDGEEALQKARSECPALILLDIMLPKMSGFDVCRQLRREMNIPVIMLTAREDEIDKILGLELGADDYITKPFSMRELLARIKAVLRRFSHGQPQENPAVLESGPLRIDLARREAVLQGNALELSYKEFELLKLLVQNSGKVVTRDKLLTGVWGEDYFGDTRTLDVHIRWLREKLESGGGQGLRISTVRGVGYKFESEND